MSLPALVLFCLYDNSHSLLSGFRRYFIVALICIWWLVIFSTFLCTCWPFLCHLLRNVNSIPSPFFKIGLHGFFFAIELFGSLMYFWILTLIKRVDLQKFSFPWVVPSFCWLLPLLCRSFFVWRNPIYLFCFCCLCFWDYIGEKKNQYPDKCQDFPCVFSS